ncbi:MAG: hypothetical protein QOI26_1658 [Pseudonocardiales bacterium]|jgi:hypothetical protein|nr:hypothetical protein [Pseudonocardiales bacterium]
MADATARRVARSDGLKGLARLGLAARASIYLLIGWLALLLARGKRSGEADQRGAMQEVARHNGGFLLLWVIAIGLAGYALWRLSEAAFGAVSEGKDAHEKGPRLKSLVRGCVYAFFAVSAFNLLAHARSKSQAGQTELLTARVMKYPAGRVVIGIIGAVVIGIGLMMIYEGVTGKFKKYFALSEMPAGSRRIVWFLGTFGTAARGVVFGLTGFFLIRAAWEYDASKARGLDGALRNTVADSNIGRLLVAVVAVGMIAFGLYGYAEAAWRRT